MSEKSITYKIRIDSDLKELIPGFLKNREIDIEKIDQALEESDFNTISLLGHSMKGNGSGYGFDRISELGKAIESSARDKNREEIRQRLVDLSDFLHHLEIEYI